MYAKYIHCELSHYAELAGGLTHFKQNAKLKTKNDLLVIQLLVSDYFHQAFVSNVYASQDIEKTYYRIETEPTKYRVKEEGYILELSSCTYKMSHTFDEIAYKVHHIVSDKRLTPADFPDKKDIELILWNEINQAFDAAYSSGEYAKPNAKDVVNLITSI